MLKVTHSTMPATEATAALDPKVCERCGKPYIPRQFWQRWCGRQCRQLAYWARRLAKAAP